MTRRDEMIDRVFQALLRGDLGREDLGARRLSTWLGQSTIGLYHHFGSLDGFLICIDGAGWRYLLGRLEHAQARGADIEALALEYVAFATSHPVLYEIMATRPFPRASLREEGRLRAETPLLDGFGALLARAGSRDPSNDTLLVFAALHGLASLAASGRLELGEGSETRLRSVARSVARLVCPAEVGATARPGVHNRSGG